MHLITLLSDFGINNAYVGQMKGVIYSIAPMAQCVDITHSIPPQQISIGSFLLASSVDYFPKGTIHVAVVDPGVGTARRGIVVVTSKHIFVGPDNGLLIDASKKQGYFDVYEIKEWLGHTKIETTMAYIKDAKHYYQQAPYDWIHRTLRACPKNSEDCAEKSNKAKKRVLYPKSLREKITPPTRLEPVTAR